jgi:hypothetical protein
MPISTDKSSPISVIVRAWILCGIMDITAATLHTLALGGKPFRMLQGIASGALGPSSFDGSWKTAALGLGFHFFIALTWTTFFYLASRRLTFMTARPVVSGITYGVFVYLVMYWVVVPLSLIHRRPFSLVNTVIAIITHMVCVGLPISLTVRRYSK